MDSVRVTEKGQDAAGPADEVVVTTLPHDSSDWIEYRLSAGRTFLEMFDELRDSSELLWQMTVRDLKLRYKQAMMGFAWAILMPMLVVVCGALVRYVMSVITSTTLQPDAIAGMVVKALPWGFFVGALSFAVPSLTANLQLITKIYFPREVIPLSAVLTQLCDSAIGGTVVGIVVFGFSRVPLSWNVLWLVPLGLLFVMFTAGVALFLSCANLFFRDVKYIVQLFLNFGIFATPVFYEPQMLGWVGSHVIFLNPLTPFLEGMRLAAVESHNLLLPLMARTASGAFVVEWQPWYLAYAAIIAIVTFFGSWFMFHKLEFVYAEYI